MPESPPGPATPILVEFGLTGGDGGTSYDLLLGRSSPSLVLYPDGLLLISGDRYGTGDWYVQKRLSTAEMCRLLKAIGSTGFFD